MLLVRRRGPRAAATAISSDTTPANDVRPPPEAQPHPDGESPEVPASFPSLPPSPPPPAWIVMFAQWW